MGLKLDLTVFLPKRSSLLFILVNDITILSGTQIRNFRFPHLPILPIPILSCVDIIIFTFLIYAFLSIPQSGSSAQILSVSCLDNSVHFSLYCQGHLHWPPFSRPHSAKPLEIPRFYHILLYCQSFTHAVCSAQMVFFLFSTWQTQPSFIFKNLAPTSLPL